MSLSRRLMQARLVASQLSGRLVFDLPHYRESELSRLANMFAHLDVQSMAGARILEVGAGLGRLGDAFRTLGFDVTSSDARQEYVDRMRGRGCRAVLLDLDRDDLRSAGEFDVILAFGVLYHLSEPERFLHNCAATAKTLLLESCVSDNADAVCPFIDERTGWMGQDQAANRRGCRPSPSWVETTCRDAGYAQVNDVSTAIANWRFGIFDWDIQGTGQWARGAANLRKMWICRATPAGET